MIVLRRLFPVLMLSVVSTLALAQTWPAKPVFDTTS